MAESRVFELPADNKFLAADSCELDLGKYGEADVVLLTIGGFIGLTDQGGRLYVLMRVDDFRLLLSSGRAILERNGL